MSLDEAKEKQKIEAVKQEKLKLESQLKSLILLQNRITEDSPDLIRGSQLDQMTEETLFDHKRLEGFVKEAQTQLVEQFESGMLTKGSIRHVMSQLN